MFKAENVLKRYDPEEKKALLSALLEGAVPVDSEPVELITFAEVYDEAELIAERGNQFSGLATGFPSTIDKMTMGLGAGDVAVVYGYTSMGKSQLTQNIALNVARAGTPVLFIGLELTTQQNSARFIRMGGNDRSLPFLFPPTPDVKYTDIQHYIERAKRDGCGLVIVDQLQDLIHNIANEQGEITQIMAELKRSAILYEVPVIVVSHVNRIGSQPGPPPLEVLKGSSSIEQKTDIALSVYRNHNAEENSIDYRKMAVRLTKNRHKGMEGVRNAMLDVGKGMRLTEESATIMGVFPGAEMTFGI